MILCCTIYVNFFPWFVYLFIFSSNLIWLTYCMCMVQWLKGSLSDPRECFELFYFVLMTKHHHSRAIVFLSFLSNGFSFVQDFWLGTWTQDKPSHKYDFPNWDIMTSTWRQHYLWMYLWNRDKNLPYLHTTSPLKLPSGGGSDICLVHQTSTEGGLNYEEIRIRDSAQFRATKIKLTWQVNSAEAKRQPLLICCRKEDMYFLWPDIYAARSPCRY